MAHLSTAEKKAAMRSTPEEDPEFQIAPMIDILLVLLVFFMSIASTEVLQTNDAVKLPIAKDAQERKKTGEIEGQTVINVLWNPMNNAGSIDIDGKLFSQPPEIVPEIQKRLAAKPTMRILMRADKNVKYEYTRQLLQAAGTAGVSNVTFSVVDKENEAAPAAAAPAP